MKNFLFLIMLCLCALNARTQTRIERDFVVANQILLLGDGGQLIISGTTVTGISNDPDLADSSVYELMTEAAVKAFVQSYVEEHGGATSLTFTDSGTIDFIEAISGDELTAEIKASSVNGTHIQTASIPLSDLQTTPWHSSNDGAGSGLDADFLDGQNSTVFAKADSITALRAAVTVLQSQSHTAVTVADHATIDFTLSGQNITAQVPDGAINSAKIANGTIAAADLSQMGAATGQVIKWNGSAWAPANDATGGGGGSIANAIAFQSRFDTVTNLTVYKNKYVSDVTSALYFVDSTLNRVMLRDPLEINAVHAIIVLGAQSNGAGRALIDSLAAFLKAPTDSIYIADWEVDDFVKLDIGTNNMADNSSVNHGMEAGLIKYYPQVFGSLKRPLYIIKYAEGSTPATDWTPNGTGANFNINQAWFIQKFMTKLIKNGKIPYVYAYFAQGENESGTGLASSHKDSVRAIIKHYRQFLPNLPVFIQQIRGGTTVNNGFAEIANTDNLVEVIPSSTWPHIGDGVHFDDAAQDSIAGYFVNYMKVHRGAKWHQNIIKQPEVDSVFYDFEVSKKNLYLFTEIWTDGIIDTVKINNKGWFRNEGGIHEFHRAKKTYDGGTGKIARFWQTPYNAKTYSAKFKMRFNSGEAHMAFLPCLNYFNKVADSYFIDFASSSNTIRVRACLNGVNTSNFGSTTATTLDVNTDYYVRIIQSPDSIKVQFAPSYNGTYTTVLSTFIPLASRVESGSFGFASGYAGTSPSNAIIDSLAISWGYEVDNLAGLNTSTFLDSKWTKVGATGLVPGENTIVKVTVGSPTPTTNGPGVFNSMVTGNGTAYFTATDAQTVFIEAGSGSTDATNIPRLQFVANNGAENAPIGYITNRDVLAFAPGSANLNGATQPFTISSTGIAVNKAAPDAGIAADISGNATITNNLIVDANTLVVNAAGDNIGIGTTAPTFSLGLGGNVNRTIGMERRTSDSNGNNLSISAGGAFAGGTNRIAGNLTLNAGISTGTGGGVGSGGNIIFSTPTPSSSGTSDNAPTTKMFIRNDGNIGIGTTGPSALLTLGDATTSKLGVLAMAGNTSGLVTIQPKSAAGTWTLTLPDNDGNPGQVWSTDGAGNISWADPSGGTFGDGSYTPTLTIIGNLSALTALPCQYSRVGNTFTISGGFTADPTTVGATTGFFMSLPVAGTFAGQSSAGGTGASEGANTTPVSISAGATQLVFGWLPNSGASENYFFSCTYRIL